MNNIINQEVSKFVNERSFNLKQSNHLRNSNVFNQKLNEVDENMRKQVLDLIKNNQWETPDANRFYESMKQSKHVLMLTDYTPAELSKMQLFKLKGFNIGFALKPFENSLEIVAVHNNEPEVKNIGDALVHSAVDNGGCYLDHFDGYLSNLYKNMGFIEYKRDKFDPQYDQGGQFAKQYGQSDIIYRVHDTCAA